MEKIVSDVGIPSMYEQLAEECVELAKECLKMSRIIRDENPTPKSEIEVAASIEEEFNDVLLVAALLELNPNEKQMNEKLKRWERRIDIKRRKKNA